MSLHTAKAPGRPEVSEVSKDITVKALLAQTKWQRERQKLRSLILDCGLDESVKWGKLCYAHAGRNVVIIYGLKDYCALGFFKGAVLEDDAKILVAPGKHSQAMRQLRFASIDEIIAAEAHINDMLAKAIRAEKDGLEVAFHAKDQLVYPEELQLALAGDAELARAFGELTPGRQRGSVLYFSDARQATTRRRRIEQCRAKILAGKGRQER